MKTWKNRDKTGWGDGPWQDEPDKVQWIDEETGLDCLIVRGPMGALCGYVGVPPEHPWHGLDYAGETNEEGERDYEGSPEAVVEVHGGLTYSDRCMEDAPEGEGICHIPEPGRPADVWWFGFDCHHFMDLGPAFEMRQRELEARYPLLSTLDERKIYRDVDYAKAEVTSLAAQLATV